MHFGIFFQVVIDTNCKNLLEEKNWNWISKWFSNSWWGSNQNPMKIFKKNRFNLLSGSRIQKKKSLVSWVDKPIGTATIFISMTSILNSYRNLSELLVWKHFTINRPYLLNEIINSHDKMLAGEGKRKLALYSFKISTSTEDIFLEKLYSIQHSEFLENEKKVFRSK